MSDAPEGLPSRFRELWNWSSGSPPTHVHNHPSILLGKVQEALADLAAANLRAERAEQRFKDVTAHRLADAEIFERHVRERIERAERVAKAAERERDEVVEVLREVQRFLWALWNSHPSLSGRHITDIRKMGDRLAAVLKKHGGE